jgi:hypothetical protein
MNGAVRNQSKYVMVHPLLDGPDSFERITAGIFKNIAERLNDSDIIYEGLRLTQGGMTIFQYNSEEETKVKSILENGDGTADMPNVEKIEYIKAC